MILLNKFIYARKLLFDLTRFVRQYKITLPRKRIDIVVWPNHDMCEISYYVIIPTLGYRLYTQILMVGEHTHATRYNYDVSRRNIPCVSYSSYDRSTWLVNPLVASVENVMKLNSKRTYATCLEFYDDRQTAGRHAIRQYLYAPIK